MKYFVSVAILSSLLFSSCSEEAFDTPVQEPDASDVINIEGQIVQEAVTRANDDGFADGDKIGIYIVDYEGTQPGTLKNQGNRADNVHHTFDETTTRRKPPYNI